MLAAVGLAGIVGLSAETRIRLSPGGPHGPKRAGGGPCGPPPLRSHARRGQSVMANGLPGSVAPVADAARGTVIRATAHTAGAARVGGDTRGAARDAER